MPAWSSLLGNFGVEQKNVDLMMEYVLENRIQCGITAGVVTLVTYGLYRRLTLKRYNLPPGPRGLPMVGNAVALMRTTKIWQLLTDWGKEYGDVYLIYFGSAPTIILNSAEVTRDAYIHQGVEYADRPKTHSFDLFTYGGKDIAFGNYSEMWKLKRKIALGALRKYAQGNHLDKVVEHSMQKVDEFVKKQDGPFEPSKMTKLMVYNIIGITCFGKIYDSDDPFLEKLSRATDEMNELLGLGLLADFFPVFKYLPSSARNLMLEFRDWFIGYILEQLKEHRKNFDPDNVSDFTSHLIATQKEAEANPEERSLLSEMDDLELALVIMDIFSAGIDTTRITLHWIVGYMVAYPDIQAKIQQELDQVLGGRQVSVADKDSLTYTNAVIHEVMRIKPIVFMGLPHMTRSDTKLNGYDIPQGTQVFTNVWGIHLDERHWANPTEFKPERWLDESGNFIFQQKGYLPFSMGRRNCIGETLAKVDILMSVASLLQRMNLVYAGSGSLNLEPKFSAQVVEPQLFEVTAKMRN